MHHQELPPGTFIINPNTTDTPPTELLPDGRPVLVGMDAGVPVDAATTVTAGTLPTLKWHCSFSYDNDANVHKAAMPIGFLGDRADYTRGRTFSANWGTGPAAGMCLLWTDGHAAWANSRTVKCRAIRTSTTTTSSVARVRTRCAVHGVSVLQGTQDTHLRFFSEDEDDVVLLTDWPL